MFIKNISFEKKFFKVTFDNDEYVKVSEDTLVRYNLYKGLEVSEDFPEILEYEDEKTRALNISYKFLERLKTKKQLVDHLYKNKIKPQIIDEVIETCREKKYLNDLDYGLRYLNDAQNIKKYGKIKTIYMLKSKGIESQDIDEIMKSYNYDLEYENAKELLYKKIDASDFNIKKLNSAKKYLMGRGFEYDIISSVTGDLSES
ncbi:RecX family transcriptional regulator [Peptoniphilus sp. MSJ-1]|uniref:Regulatory protein RecX n=1 Tax=Peptoniphilus ovalis TaxID=2841503 RepID=A0ABS6FG40_9FIRM|nr:RecX family transcriptional regulator [Peptoniphilus ovalis]MBU5669147.1 RecX family transcriptional regulator [Peptoniphilus ovalis]